MYNCIMFNLPTLRLTILIKGCLVPWRVLTWHRIDGDAVRHVTVRCYFHLKSRDARPPFYSSCQLCNVSCHHIYNVNVQ
jgi:hypothetical protein